MSAFDLAVQRNDTALLAAVTRMEAELAKEHPQADRLECIEALNEYLQRYPPGSQYTLSGPPERVYLKVVARSMPLTELQHLLPPKEYPPLPERSSKYLLWWDKPMLKAWMLVRDDRGVDAVTKELLAATEPSPERAEMQTHIKFHLPTAAAETARAMFQVADLLRSGTAFEALAYVSADLILPLWNAQTVFNRPYLCETALSWPDFVEKALLNLPDAREVFSREASVLVTLANGVVLRSLAPGIPTKASLDSFAARLRAADANLEKSLSAELAMAASALSALAGNYLAAEPEVASAKERVRRDLTAFAEAVTQSLHTRSGPPATSLAESLHELRSAQTYAEARLRREQEERSRQEAARKEERRREEQQEEARLRREQDEKRRQDEKLRRAARNEENRKAQQAQQKSSYRDQDAMRRGEQAAAEYDRRRNAGTSEPSNAFLQNSVSLAAIIESVLQNFSQEEVIENARVIMTEENIGAELQSKIIGALSKTKDAVLDSATSQSLNLIVEWNDLVSTLRAKPADYQTNFAEIELLLQNGADRTESRVSSLSRQIAQQDTISSADFRSSDPIFTAGEETCPFDSLMVGLFWKRGGYFSRVVRTAERLSTPKLCDADGLHRAVLDDCALMEKLPRVSEREQACKTALLWSNCMRSIKAAGERADPIEILTELMEFYGVSKSMVMFENNVFIGPRGPRTMVAVEMFQTREVKSVELAKKVDNHMFDLWCAIGYNGGHYEALVQQEQGWFRVDPSLQQDRRVKALPAPNPNLRATYGNPFRMAVYVKRITSQVPWNLRTNLVSSAWPLETSEVLDLLAPGREEIKLDYAIAAPWSAAEEIQLVHDMFFKQEGETTVVYLRSGLQNDWGEGEDETFDRQILTLFALDQYIIGFLDTTRRAAAIQKIRHALIGFDVPRWRDLLRLP